MSVLTPFLEELDQKGMKIESATHLWDCVSQMVRQHHKGGLKRFSTCATEAIPQRNRGAARVRKPAHTHFVGLKRVPKHA